MGIKSLSQHLRKNHPELFKPVHLSEYAFKKVAIDTSLYMHKYKYIYQDKWLKGFLGLVSCLRKNEIHCVFVYDSSAPIEKEGERAERAKQREKIENDLLNLQSAVNKYINDNELDPILNEFKVIKPVKQSLFGFEDTEPKEQIDLKAIETKVNRLQSNIISIRPEDFQMTKDLFEILKIPYYNAPMEAETACSDLCKRGLVDAVLSEDTDVLAYGAPTFLTKIDTNSSICYKIDFQEVLEAMKLSADTFLDFCIMCGCDYNKNIPKIGPGNAFKLMSLFGSIEALAEARKDLDISILNHVRVRELFREYTPIPVDYVPYCGQPDFDVLAEFFESQDIDININNVRKNFTNELVFA
jgi:5'-3' exonuclease